MSFEKKEGNGPGSFLKSFLNMLPFLKKEEPEWDDGTSDISDSQEDAKSHLMYVVMSVYGAATGFLGCQYCKYLHQRFACYAWGVPLTSQPIKAYGVPNLVVDIIAVFCVYALVGALGMLINKLLKMIFSGQVRNIQEVGNSSLMYGFLFLIAVSLVMLFIPFNLFLIGV